MTTKRLDAAGPDCMICHKPTMRPFVFKEMTALVNVGTIPSQDWELILLAFCVSSHHGEWHPDFVIAEEIEL